MKKPHIHPLILTTVLFTVFTGGFFLGRNYNHSDVQFLSARAASPSVQTAETEIPEAGSPAQALISGEQSAAELPASNETLTAGLVNINTATAAQLETLPGIGTVIAQRIVDYRREHGPFPSATALLNVEGIGEKRLAAIIHLVTV